MSFYNTPTSRFIEVSAPLSRDEQLKLVSVWFTKLNKPNGAGGCYLIECRNPLIRCYIIHWLKSTRTRSDVHLDKHTKSWTPVRFCDLRKGS